MKNLLLRSSILITALYCAVGAGFVVTAAHTQGVGWIHFSLSELILIYFGLFTLPMTILLWVVWAFFRRVQRPHVWVAFSVIGILLPFIYALLLSLLRIHS